MKYAIFDTETDHLLSNILKTEEYQPHIIEFYGCIIDDCDCEIIEELEFMCKPPVKIPKESIDITGITNEMVANELPFSTYVSSVRNFFGKADGVVAHNVSFDMSVIDIEFRRLGESITWPKIKLCTVEQTMHLKGHALNLTDLYHLYFPDDKFKKHRAKTDTLALKRVFSHLLNTGEI